MIDVRPLTPDIGAEVHGIDLGASCDPGTGPARRLMERVTIVGDRPV